MSDLLQLPQDSRCLWQVHEG